MKGTIVRKRKEHTEFQMKRNKKTWLAVAGAITAGLCILVLTSKGFKSMERSTLLPVKKQAEKVTEMIGSIAQAALQTQKNIAVKEAFPALKEEYELVYANIPIFQFGTTGSYFKDTDIYADLYRKEIWENGKEGVELSLWADRREIWHTIKNGDEKDFTLYPLFWQENSTNITSNQYISYYVIEREDNVYLMRYRMEESDKEVTLSYKVFGMAGNSLLHTASEVPYDAGSISFYLVTDGMTEPEATFPVERMVAFYDTVKSYMENGISIDKDNQAAPYLYDIFPWLPEMAAGQQINIKDMHSVREVLTQVQKSLPVDESVTMPELSSDGKYFITGNYYSNEDESFLTVKRKEDGSYEGILLIDNVLYTRFEGECRNGILTAVQSIEESEEPQSEMKISFENGKATVTLSNKSEINSIGEGAVSTFDSYAKQEEFRNLKNAYPITK